MDVELVSLLCYTSGEILNGPDGIYYDRPPTKGINIPKDTNYKTLIKLLKKTLGIEIGSLPTFDIVYRYPVTFPNRACQFEPIYIQNEKDLQFVLNIGFALPPPRTLQLYIKVRTYVRVPIYKTSYAAGDVFTKSPPDRQPKRKSSEFIEYEYYDVVDETDASLVKDGARALRSSKRRTPIEPVGRVINRKQRVTSIPPPPPQVYDVTVSQSNFPFREGNAGASEVKDFNSINADEY